MVYPPDPGGQFASDAHRRVCGYLREHDEEPISVHDLYLRLVGDEHTPVADEAALGVLLEELKDSGLAEKVDGDWRRTELGLETLNAPVAGEES